MIIEKCIILPKLLLRGQKWVVPASLMLPICLFLGGNWEGHNRGCFRECSNGFRYFAPPPPLPTHLYELQCLQFKLIPVAVLCHGMTQLLKEPEVQTMWVASRRQWYETGRSIAARWACSGFHQLHIVGYWSPLYAPIGHRRSMH